MSVSDSENSVKDEAGGQWQVLGLRCSAIGTGLAWDTRNDGGPTRVFSRGWVDASAAVG